MELNFEAQSSEVRLRFSQERAERGNRRGLQAVGEWKPAEQSQPYLPPGDGAAAASGAERDASKDFELIGFCGASRIGSIGCPSSVAEERTGLDAPECEVNSGAGGEAGF